MKAALPYTDCRFCIYDQDYTTADGTTSIYIEIYLHIY